MENLSTITCGTFLEELASKAPTPGGGAASALCGAVAAALTAMLANLTVGKARGCCGGAYGHACQFNCWQSRQRRK